MIRLSRPRSGGYGYFPVAASPLGPLQARNNGTGGSKRDLVVAQVAFYSGARAVLKVLDHMSSKGDFAEVQRTIERHGRQINRLQGRRPRAQQH